MVQKTQKEQEFLDSGVGLLEERTQKILKDYPLINTCGKAFTKEQEAHLKEYKVYHFRNLENQKDIQFLFGTPQYAVWIKLKHNKKYYLPRFLAYHLNGLHYAGIQKDDSDILPTFEASPKNRFSCHEVGFGGF